MKPNKLILTTSIAAAFATLPASAAVLFDINADGTALNATVGEFEDAIGLAAGTFSGSTVSHLDFNDATNATSSPIRTGTADLITFAATSSNFTLGGDADGWFGGATSTNKLLEDGVFMRSTTGNPSGTITLSGSGLGLLANTSYDFYLFAGRNFPATGSEGHKTSFTFDVNDPTDPSGGATIAAGVPIVGGDETLGTVKFTFTTGVSAPSSLVIGWDGTRHINSSSNNDAVFSGFALVPEPSSALLGLVGFGLLLRRRRR